MKIDCWEMKKNKMKSDFEKSETLDGKIKLKTEGFCEIMCGRVQVYRVW